MEIDFYNFDWYVHVFNYFTPERHFCKIDDISYGKENTPVSCVNSLDNNYPEYVEYSTERLPQKGVQIPLDEGFLTCCDCTDDCQDKSKCSCWQLTINTTAAEGDGLIKPNSGSEVEELNRKVQFSSKVHFYGELELNLVHFLAKWTWTELSSLFGWTWTKMN